MSLKPQAIGPVPEETARIARAAYPKGNIYMQLRDDSGRSMRMNSSLTCSRSVVNPLRHPGG